MTVFLSAMRCALGGARLDGSRRSPACRPGLLFSPEHGDSLAPPFDNGYVNDDDENEVDENDDDWDEFDPTPLESWIQSDFDWDIEMPYPERGDFWDSSLDHEWDSARAAGLKPALQ